MELLTQSEHAKLEDKINEVAKSSILLGENARVALDQIEYINLVE